MGCTQYSDIHRNFFAGSNRHDRFFLDNAEQLDLHMQGQVGDFIQHQCSTVCGLE